MENINTLQHNKKCNKVSKIILYIILSLVGIFILFLVGTSITNIVLLNKEYKFLESEGYVNLVSVGDYRLNVYSCGNRDSENTIVVIAGLGMNNTSITMRQMTKNLENDNHFVFIDRAGYGLSDDSNLSQTNEQIVKDYRTALKNSNINGPYILMAHSIGGAYATWWETKYPNEIKAVVFIDGTQLSATAFNDEMERSSKIEDFFINLAGKLGLHRLAFRNYCYYLPNNYNKKEQKLSDLLNVRSITNKAPTNEANLIDINAQKAFNQIVTNNIPKIYICASWGFNTIQEVDEYLTFIRTMQEKNNLEIGSGNVSEEVKQGLIDSCKEKRETDLKPYIDKLGNCEFVLLGGDHMIYKQKPTECGNIIKNFLQKLMIK